MRALQALCWRQRQINQGRPWGNSHAIAFPPDLMHRCIVDIMDAEHRCMDVLMEADLL